MSVTMAGEDAGDAASSDQHVAIATTLSEQRLRNTLRLDADAANMMPAPGL